MVAPYEGIEIAEIQFQCEHHAAESELRISTKLKKKKKRKVGKPDNNQKLILAC